MITLTDHERRVLAYLDQHGPTHRARVVEDLAHPDSKTGRGASSGTNGAAPLIMGRWCRRLVAAGFVECRTHGRGWYRDHAITPAGRSALRQPIGTASPDREALANATLTRQSYGIAMAQGTFGRPAGVWLECSGCNRSDVIVGSNSAAWVAVPSGAVVYRQWHGDAR